MGLYYFHYVLIGAAICGDLFFTLFCLRRYNESSEVQMLVMAICSSIVTFLFVGYLVYFIKHMPVIRQRLQTPRCGSCGYSLVGSSGDSSRCPECGAALGEGAVSA